MDFDKTLEQLAENIGNLQMKLANKLANMSRGYRYYAEEAAVYQAEIARNQELFDRVLQRATTPNEEKQR